MELGGESNVEEVGFESGFEGLNCGGISDCPGKCIPQGRGSKGKRSVTPCTAFRLGDIEEVCITRPEGAGGGMTFEEVAEVWGSQVV